MCCSRFCRSVFGGRWSLCVVSFFFVIFDVVLFEVCVILFAIVCDSMFVFFNVVACRLVRVVVCLLKVGRFSFRVCGLLRAFAC